MAKLNLQLKPRQVILLALGAIAVLVLFNCMSGKSSYYTAPTPSNGEPMIGGEDADDEAPVDGPAPQEVNACALQAGGSGLSSAVSIFNTSTIEPDQMRPPFEIGAGLA